MGDKEDAVGKAIKDLEKDYGKGIVMQMGDSDKYEVSSIPTGSRILDTATGVGGWPRGRTIEIYGNESCGKSFLSLLSIAEVQKAGGTAALIDVEHSFVPKWATKLGVDVKKLYISQEDCAEDALEVVDALVRSGGIDLIVLDSIASLVPRAEIEGSMSDQHMALMARIMGQALRKLNKSIYSTKTTCLFINQLREKVGIRFGEKNVTPGGRALKFYASMRVEVSKVPGSTIKEGDVKVGHKVKCYFKKNKVAPPFREACFTVNFVNGIDRDAEIVDLALINGYITQEGDEFKLGDKLYSSRKRLETAIKKDPSLLENIKKDKQEKK